MTMERIIELATFAAIDNWITAREKANKTPNNRLRQLLEQRYWEELTEIENIQKALKKTPI